VDELVVAGPDDGLDQASVGEGFHGQEMLTLVATFNKVAGTILPSPSWPAALK